MRGALSAAALLGAACSAQAASEWADLFSPPFTGVPVSIMMGISCTAEDACFVAGGTTSAVGAFKVTDPTWKSPPQLLNVSSPIPLKLLLSIAQEDSTHGVAGGLGVGVGGTYYTVDGFDYGPSELEIGFVQTQAVYSLGGGKYAYAGTYNSHQGVAVSTNGGVRFQGRWLPKNFSVAPVRYAAFPSDQVIYMTGGMWPSDNNQQVSGMHDVNARVRYNSNTAKFENRAPVLAQDNVTGYTAMLAKSEDGGKTWVKQFESQDQFYFNGISCASETVCMAVAEGFAQDGSTAPGAHVFKTTDGKTWTKIYTYGAATGGSALDVKMLSETEAWVGFTFAESTLNSGAAFGHTTDGGKTWTHSPTLNGVGTVTQMSFIDDNNAFAVAVTVYQISTVMRFGPQ